MKKILLSVGFVLSGFTAWAQNGLPRIQDVDLNDVRGQVQANGVLWWDFITRRGLEVPKQLVSGAPSKHTVFTANLWMGGIDSSGTLRVAAETYRQQNPYYMGQTESGYSSGPLAASYPTHVPRVGDPAFDHIWKINRSELLDFQQHYQQAGYVPPVAIATWPATGNIANGRAPFVDVNQDGRYSPANGDYPDVPGDQALYFIINDEAQAKIPFTPAIGAEVQGFVYTFDAAGSGNALDQTVFVRYQITNRSPRTYHDFYFGHWVDFDLGNFTDDYVGCDRTRQMIYAYNGDSIDEGLLGYGTNPPAQGVVLLSDSMAGFTTYTDDFAITGNPWTGEDLYNYLWGHWKQDLRRGWQEDRKGRI